jgi:hypothetical protein
LNHWLTYIDAGKATTAATKFWQDQIKAKT